MPASKAEAADAAISFALLARLERLTVHAEDSWRPACEVLEALTGPLMAHDASGAAPRWAPPVLRWATLNLPAGGVNGGVWRCCERLSAAARHNLEFEIYGRQQPGEATAQSGAPCLVHPSCYLPEGEF